MGAKHRPLWTLRELPPHVDKGLWDQFKARARAAGYLPTAAVGRMLRRYVARGFDDGGPETNPNPQPTASRQEGEEPID